MTEASGIKELLCEHKGSGKSPFAHGLCGNCYEDFIKLSGGLNGGSQPPAFQHAEMERIMAEEAAAQRSKYLDSLALRGQAENRNNLIKYSSGNGITLVEGAAEKGAGCCTDFGHGLRTSRL